MWRPRPHRALVVLATATIALSAAAGCGNDLEDAPGADDTVTGRLMSLTDEQYCVSPDRGETETCVDIPDPKAVEGLDVGECVTTTTDLTSEDSFVEVVDDAECAGGDLGEPSDD